MVLFTDGVDIDSRTTAEQSLLEAEAGEALIYSVYYDTKAVLREKLRAANASSTYGAGIINSSNTDSDYAAGRNYLERLAKKTGAQMYQASNPTKMAAAFASIAEGLRAQYSLGYYPSNPPRAGQRRKIKIQVARPKLVVDARDSYLCRSPIGNK